VRDFIVVQADQRTPEWYAARVGRLTGSCASDMLATIKSGEAAGRRNLRLRLVLERLTQRSQEGDFVSAAMLAGIEREPQAFAAYEALTGNMVERVGFCSHVEHMAGCSPDGHLGDFTVLLSIKCRQPAAHLEFLRTGTVPAASMAQIRHELWITEAIEHTYFSWNPDFPEPLQSRLVTIARADAEIAEYEKAALAFLAEVESEVLAVCTMTDLAGQLKAAVA
jgi:hypothetical protein